MSSFDDYLRLQEEKNEEIFTNQVFNALKSGLEYAEITEEIRNQIDLVILGSKITHSIADERVKMLLFMAFLRLPGNDQIEGLKKRIDGYSTLLNHYYMRPSYQFFLLEGVKAHFSSNPSFAPHIAGLLKHLSDRRIVAVRSILEWYEGILEEEEEADILALIRPLLRTL
ncbi:hypothetical protein PFISCL1PPCAC_19080 [Pristionchus fissidentatus]|uniref:W2 domain-containing protein n=1 Tax=Pristionchus fissidentatus TaxID=1538716 RepID=A0AAV5W8B5_9BILA|nr:hypothetical protein PFISCL1PPCAC_19080 [Pristionchus fissidentatus]